MNLIKPTSQYPVAKLLYHIKIIVSSALLALVFTWVRGEQPVVEIFLMCFVMLCIQLEILLWLAPKALKFKTLPTTSSGFIKSRIYRLIIFYLGVLLISVSIVLLVLSAGLLLKGGNPKTHLHYLVTHELKEFLKFYALCLSLSSIIHFYFLWTDALRREQALREEKLLFQFETLKSQVNPHFLFNSLNTLSSLISIDPALADQFIHKLSAIYHYVLEYREVEYVALPSEIDFVRDYFYLQQIRDENKIELAIEVNDPQKYKILPISLQLLVENALKHNAATPERPLKIVLYLVDDTIIVKNNLQRKTTLEHSKKSGLNNLRQRIKYLTQKEMIVLETKEEFTVIVPLISLT